MDQIDYQIIKYLKENGKLSNVELGEKLHMSSQAIRIRRSKLEKSNNIMSYSISSPIYKLAFIEVYLNSNCFEKFEADIVKFGSSCKLHKISGSYCYMLIYEELTNKFDASLIKVLTTIEQHGRYKVNTSVKVIS